MSDFYRLKNQSCYYKHKVFDLKSLKLAKKEKKNTVGEKDFMIEDLFFFQVEQASGNL